MGKALSAVLTPDTLYPGQTKPPAARQAPRSCASIDRWRWTDFKRTADVADVFCCWYDGDVYLIAARMEYAPTAPMSILREGAASLPHEA